MEYIQIGNTDISVSRLCMGSWQVVGWASSNDDTFANTINYGIDHGLNFIDTAEGYGNGHSEKIIGNAIKGKRDKIILATKFNHTNSKPKAIRHSLERSLRNLCTDYIDIYQQHWPPKTPPLEQTIEELEKLRNEGKIRAIGVSNWMEPEWSEIDLPAQIDTLQPCYSLLWRSVEKNILPMCREHNIAVLPYSPLCQGLLTGRFKSVNDCPNDSRKSNILFSDKLFPEVVEVLGTLRSISEKHGKSLVQTALRWLLEQEGVTAPIVGASNPQQDD